MVRAVLRGLTVALVAGFAAGVWAEDAEQAAVSARAEELAPADMPGAQRIVALHRFVRDEIRQVQTRYG